MSAGRVESVEQAVAGVTLVGDHAAGATSLTVVDCTDLDEDGGSLSLPSGDVVEHGPIADGYSTSLALLEPLPQDVEDSERLGVYPARVTTFASVVVDADGESEPVPVEVPAGVAGWSTLAPGSLLTFTVSPDGNLVASDVTAAGPTVSADSFSGGTIRDELRIGPGGAIVVGDDEVGFGRFTRDGMRFSVPMASGMLYEHTVMTVGETSFGVMGPDGTRLGGISSAGAVSGTTGAFAQDVRIGGVPLLGQFGGAVLPGWLDNLPRGIVPGGRNFKSTPEQSIVTGVERAYLRVNANLEPGRLYRVRAWMRANLGVAGGALTLSLRWAKGAMAVLSSPQVPDTQTFSFPNASTNHRIVGWAEGFVEVDVATRAGFLLTYRGDYGATPAASFTHIYVEDVGPTTPVSGGDEDGGDVVVYQSTWRATASRMYDKTGAAIPDSDGRVDQWFWFGDPTDHQSSAVLFGGGAEESTHSVELGKTLPQALSGATIHKSEIFLQSKVWFSDPWGGVALSTLASSTLPASKVIDSTFWGGALEPGEGAWLAIPTSWFTNGSNRGFCIGDKDGQALNGAGVLTALSSGSFHGIDDSDPPLIRHTYSR